MDGRIHRASHLKNALKLLRLAANHLGDAAKYAPQDCGHVPQETHLAGGVRHIGRQILEIFQRNFPQELKEQSSTFCRSCEDTTGKNVEDGTIVEKEGSNGETENRQHRNQS